MYRIRSCPDPSTTLRTKGTCRRVGCAAYARMNIATDQTRRLMYIGDKKMRNKLRRREALWAFLFIAPLLIGLFVFYYFALFQNVYYSFTDLGPFGKPNFVGLRNYKRLLGDEKFYRFSVQQSLAYQKDLNL